MGTVSKHGSGCNDEGSRVKKWLGVNASMFIGSLISAHNGRKFKVTSILVSKVINFSIVNLYTPMDRRINDFVDFNPASLNLSK